MDVYVVIEYGYDDYGNLLGVFSNIENAKQVIRQADSPTDCITEVHQLDGKRVQTIRLLLPTYVVTFTLQDETGMFKNAGIFVEEDPARIDDKAKELAKRWYEDRSVTLIGYTVAPAEE